MKGKEQILNFINFIFAILLISFFIYFFIIPGNFERFQTVFLGIAPLFVMTAVLFFRIRATAKQITDQGDFLDDDAFIRLTHFDKIKLEIVLTGLPIAIILWTIMSGMQNWQTIGSSVVVFLVNTFVLKSIFKKNA